MISVDDAIRMHHELIDEFGGSKGVRDQRGLEAALARPFSTFDQQDLYPSALEKASALFESLIINHPFVDSNKRIAFTLMMLILADSQLDVEATEDELYEFVIGASTGELRFEEIKTWLQSRIIPLL
jgi:death-on-curing protein